ncbi:LuxR C-terminal-related transcriptional regulator [Bradyrhizobium sp. 199]|uniref:LuxR C-terminal-related transcriptional regulator n=1 Tax=Bradyrhizobium sp. 199 TaxID=2782664 RepID=UPI001FF76542|nr:LuxR C-terminal-related transcriptional regulator [Bradyrhizobium sp. 199]MCK1358920.1 response regulator [Bradyrhizobium sp. 199]
MLDASARHGILKPIRLVLVDRQPIVLQGLKSILGTQQDFDVVASSSDGASCLEAIRNLAPDVALIADTLPDLTLRDILAIAKAEKLSTRLVFFTESDPNNDLTAAIAAGACSAISKYAAPWTMLQSLRLMAKSGVSLEQSDLSPTGKEADGGGKIEKLLELLTPREHQIVRLVSEGMSNKEIARRLDVSQGTVKVHLHNIFQKLEITNRTVLATISLLQRTSGFSALALGLLAFAIADELKASEADDMLAHDDGSGQTDEHAGYEVCKKAVLQHLIVSKSGGTSSFAERDLLAKASQAATPAAAIEALRAAEQFLGSKLWKDGGPVGSGTPGLPALLLRGSNDALTGGDPAREDHLPRLAPNPMPIQGGYATFAAVAGALIYELSEAQHAAQAHGPDQASIDSVLAGIGDKVTAKLAAVSDVEVNHADNAAPKFLSHDFGPHSDFVTPANSVTQQGVPGNAALDGAGHNLQTSVDVLDASHDPSAGGHGRDQLLGANFANAPDRSAADSKPAPSDAVVDVASGPGRLNLAAFGALASLHLTAAAKSIPPHTLAWIYDPESNQTIVYVNPTDHILDVGDRSLVEVHLQGIVSVAESDFVHQPGGTAVAVTLEQLEQMLMAAAIDETALSPNSSHANEDSLEAADVWSPWADDGLSFQFAHLRTGSGTSAKSGAYSSDSADATEESASVSGGSAYGSSIAPGHGAAPPSVENPSAKNEPANSNTGAPPAKQSEIVQPGIDTVDGAGRANSEHDPEPGSAKAEMAQEESKPGNSVGHGNEHHSQAEDGSPGAAKIAEPDLSLGNSGHSASAKGAQAADAAEPSVVTADKTSHGPAQQGVEPGSATAAAEMAAAKSKPGNGVGNDHEHHSQASDTPPEAAKTVEPSGVEHGNPGHSTSAKGTEEGESAAAPGHAEHGHSQHGAEPGSATAAVEMADAKSKPGHGVGNDHEHHSQAPDTPGAAKTAEASGVEHGNSGHSTSGKGTEAGESAATPGHAEHGHSQHVAEPGSAKAAAVEMTEVEPRSGNVGHGNTHDSQALDGSPDAANTAEPGGGTDRQSSRSISAEGADPGQSAAAHGNTDHGKSLQAAHSGATPSEAAQPAKAASEAGADQQSVFRFDGEVAPSTLVIAVEPKEHHMPHAALGQADDLRMIAAMVPPVLGEHAAQHGNHGQHPGALHGSHDLLI